MDNDKSGRPAEPYSQTKRLIKILEILHHRRNSGITLEEICNFFGVGKRTASRDIAALQEIHIPIYSETDNRTKIWKLMPSYQKNLVSLNTTEMIALYLGKTLFRFLDGTGLESDIKSAFEKLESHFKREDLASLPAFKRKFYFVPEALKDYSSSSEIVDDIITALMKDQKLELIYRSIGKKTQKKHIVHPYTILIYKQGIYLIGFVETYGEIRTFAIERIIDTRWLRGKSFEYPDDYTPDAFTEGTFGIISGDSLEVRLSFAPEVEAYITERIWHPSQKFARGEDGRLLMTMEVRGDTELKNWLLSFGQKVKILSPTSLSRELREAYTKALAQYTE
jgi:predicted DNA-binding transcriptional regulator YafY